MPRSTISVGFARFVKSPFTVVFLMLACVYISSTLLFVRLYVGSVFRVSFFSFLGFVLFFLVFFFFSLSLLEAVCPSCVVSRYTVCARDYVACVDPCGGIMARCCTPVMFNLSTPSYSSVVCQISK